MDLEGVASLAGWCSPTAQDGSRGSLPPRPQDTGVPLSQQAVLAGWRTPDHNQRGGSYSDPEKALARLASGHQINLEDQAVLVGWATPTTRDHKDGDGQSCANVPENSLLGRQVHGALSTFSPAGTEKRGALNPAHSRWLMGYPVEWDSCGATAMPSCRKSPRSSS